MSYPFELAPFKDYFTQLRYWRKVECDKYRMLRTLNVYDEDRSLCLEQITEATKNIKKLKKENQIPAREFDVYLGEIDLALDVFIAESPQPVKPSPCLHEQSTLRLRRYKNNSMHIVEQCLICGSPIKDHRKTSVANWENLPLFDENITRKQDEEYRRWWKLRNQVIENVFGEDRKNLSFDYDKFNSDYIKLSPEPVSPENCAHQSTHITLRKYANNSTASVLQCRQCGKHIKSVSKKEIPNLAELPNFDLSIEERARESKNLWYKKKSEAAKAAKDNFERDLQNKIESREINIVDKSTFGTYYSSKEWKKTRERILQRDKSTCQACGKDAECVHHLTYDRIGKENDLDLMSLCNECHLDVHIFQDRNGFGYRLTPEEIQMLTFKLSVNCT